MQFVKLVKTKCKLYEHNCYYNNVSPCTMDIYNLYTTLYFTLQSAYRQLSKRVPLLPPLQTVCRMSNETCCAVLPAPGPPSSHQTSLPDAAAMSSDRPFFLYAASSFQQRRKSRIAVAADSCAFLALKLHFLLSPGSLNSSSVWSSLSSSRSRIVPRSFPAYLDSCRIEARHQDRCFCELKSTIRKTIVLAMDILVVTHMTSDYLEVFF